MQLPAHGANAAALYQVMGLEMPKKVIDLSENVNAQGLPDAVKEAWPKLIEKVSRYPHEEAEPFRSLAAKVHQVTSQQVLVTNGAAEGLMAIAQHVRGQKVLVLEPSFSEYKRTLQQHQCHIHTIVTSTIECYKFDVNDLHEALQEVTVCYICNPNNPTGVLIKRTWIEELLQAYPACTFIIDEAFMDWTDEAESVISLIPYYSNVIVARSMTKMFAMAGVRLGYLVGQKVEQLRGYLPHWNVSQLAIELGRICLGEQKFIKNARVSSERLLGEMKQYFQEIGCRYTDSHTNYLLFQLPKHYDAEQFFLTLLKQGIVLRHTKNYAGLNGEWFRIAVKTEEIWQRARKEIDDYVQNNSLLSP